MKKTVLTFGLISGAVSRRGRHAARQAATALGGCRKFA
jgi:hypothetical protein